MRRLLTSRWTKALAWALCLTPLFLLGWMGTRNQLGANPLEKVTHVTGDWTMSADPSAPDGWGAPAKMKQLEQQWGAAWPRAWRDMVGLGKLPASYQAVPTLEDVFLKAVAH